MTLSQAVINHWGMRLTSGLTSFNGGLIIVVAALLTAAMLAFPLSTGAGLDLSRLVSACHSGRCATGVEPVYDDHPTRIDMNIERNWHRVPGQDPVPLQTM
jgi:hypothetical protein